MHRAFFCRLYGINVSSPFSRRLYCCVHPSRKCSSDFEKHAAGDTWRRVKRLHLSLFILGLSIGGAAAQAEPAVVDIPGSADPRTRMCLRDLLIRSVTTPNTIVRMGPDVDFDFTDVKSFPIQLGQSVTLTSVASFGPIVPANPCITVAAKAVSRRVLPGHANVDIGREEMVAPLGAGASARSPHTRGPVLRYGKHPDLSATTAFLQASCSGGLANEGVRLSGFRLFGPSMGDQTTDEVGLRIDGCQDVEVSNMEIAGWGGAGIEVRNLSFSDIPPTEPNPIRVLIHDSYFHDNRHPSEGGDLDGLLGGHAEGYGVNAGLGGWMGVYNNAFDNNRHAVAANGKAGGYQAAHNLILKGGGYHGAWYEKFTHVMDAHGTDNCNTLSSSAWNCGDAGRAFTISENVFQYTRNDDINIRGNPRGRATIKNNIFARSDEGAAINGSDNSNVDVQRNNRYNVDDFGKYSICDFDGDGIDDLFFATGVTWWMSGQGRFPWTFLSADRLPRGNLRFGYFDGDPRCDVAVELPTGSGQWFISSGGVTDPFATPLATLGHPGNQIAFGRFDPSVAVELPTGSGQWFISSGGVTDPFATRWRLSDIPATR